MFRKKEDFYRVGNLYELLNIKRTAKTKKIKKAYYSKAKATHPDKSSNPNATEEFKVLSTANEILTDPQLKKLYDEFYDEVYARKSINEADKVSKTEEKTENFPKTEHEQRIITCLSIFDYLNTSNPDIQAKFIKKLEEQYREHRGETIKHTSSFTPTSISIRIESYKPSRWYTDEYTFSPNKFSCIHEYNVNNYRLSGQFIDEFNIEQHSTTKKFNTTLKKRNKHCKI